jgi:hypothetical protein
LIVETPALRLLNSGTPSFVQLKPSSVGDIGASGCPARGKGKRALVNANHELQDTHSRPQARQFDQGCDKKDSFRPSATAMF